MTQNRDVSALYPIAPSFDEGEAVEFCVSTGAPRFRIALARAVDPLARGTVADHIFAGESISEGAVDVPWDWPRVRIEAPLRPGPYVAWTVPERSELPHYVRHDSRENRALVVVRATRPKQILVLVPTFTYHAYNVGTRDPALDDTHARCLYTGARAVTLARPGGGNGGYPWDTFNLDHYDRASPRQTFEHWDRKAISWLEHQRVDVDLATDLDLHSDPQIFAGRTLLLCFGHHEYWTRAMRARVDAFVGRGGNVAFFGGNSLWFPMQYEERTQSIAHCEPWEVPEDATTGVSYRYGGGQWIGPRPPNGFRIRDPHHWLFEGLGFRIDDEFGGDLRLLGYECDGIAPDFATRISDGREIAYAPLGSWQVGSGGELAPDAHASIVVRETAGGGTVVTVGTVDWPRALWSRDPVVERITRNVLARLGRVGLDTRERG